VCDTAITPIDATPSIVVTKTETTGLDASSDGQVLTYEITVENNGNTSLTNVNVVDTLPDATTATVTFVSGDTDGDGVLDLGETWVYSASYTVTQADIDAGMDLVNEACVTTDQIGTPVCDTAITPIDATPSIAVVKTQTTGPNPVTASGQTLGYTITVENTGNVTITNVNAVDTLPDGTTGTLVFAGGDTDGDNALDVDETWTYTINYITTQADVDAGADLVNTASVTADQIIDPVEDTAVTPVDQNPQLTLVKIVDSAGDEVGEDVVYEITVTNTGNVTIDNIVIDDVDVTLISGDFNVGTLAPGEFATITVAQTITQDDINAGFIQNSATVEGDAPNDDPVTDVSDSGDETVETPDGNGNTDGDPTNDPTVQDIPQNPVLTLTKLLTTSDVDLGDQVIYEITVENTGNVTIDNIVISDADVTLISGDFNVGTLNPGESATITVSQTINQADIDAGFIQNSATVEGDAPNGDPVTDVSDAGDETVETPDGNGNTDGDPTNDPTVLDIPQTATIVLTKDSEFIDGNGNGIP
ncbi:DUF7507 domain-containing protein, partial [Gangjinia marincola]|uniref:DUF7507 domain-containing protein n=1 Tax=Gangjinia marincola TaxID=578463 RepID=UPI0031DB91C2